MTEKTKRFVCYYDLEDKRPSYVIEKADRSPMSLGENMESMRILCQTGKHIENKIARFSDPPLPGPVYDTESKTLRWPKKWDLERKLRHIDMARRGFTPGTVPPCSLDNPDEFMIQAEVTSLIEDYGKEILDLIQELEKIHTAKYKTYGQENKFFKSERLKKLNQKTSKNQEKG